MSDYDPAVGGEVHQASCDTEQSRADDDGERYKNLLLRIGSDRGVTLQVIRQYKLAEAQLRARTYAHRPDVLERHHKHDWEDTGDPCWCGSDNCVVCLVCLEENHD